MRGVRHLSVRKGYASSSFYREVAMHLRTVTLPTAAQTMHLRDTVREIGLLAQFRVWVPHH